MPGLQSSAVLKRRTSWRQPSHQLNGPYCSQPLSGYLQVIYSMERETGFEPATSSLGISAEIESKNQRRPWRCTLTTANRPEIGRFFKIPSNGVNGVKLQDFVLGSARAILNPPLDRPIALFRTALEAIHVTYKSS